MNTLQIAKTCACCGSSALKRSPAVLMPFVADRTFGWAPVKIDLTWGLNTIQQGNAYTLCNSLHCSDCGLLFCDIRFGDTQMENLYRDYRGTEYTLLREKYEPGYTERNNNLKLGTDYRPDVENFLKPLLNGSLNILDWGGDTGKNTPFQNQDSLIHIYDISNVQPIGKAKSMSLDMLAKNNYNLIICSNVLEHTPHIKEELDKISAYMNSKTTLYIEVPKEDLISLNDNVSNLSEIKRHWHEHINFFSKLSLELLLKRCSMTIISYKEHEIELEGKIHTQFFIAAKKV